MAEASNALVLTGSLGSSNPIYGAKRDISADNGYYLAKVDGSKSYYVVYREPDFFDFHEHTSTSSKIISSPNCDIPLGFVARSAQGWDKTGITLFEHHFYCGTARNYTTSSPDITEEFPKGDRGASAIIVMKGWWSLHSEKNYKGIQISIHGQSEFGPGTEICSLGAAQDKVKSIKYIREN